MPTLRGRTEGDVVIARLYGGPKNGYAERVTPVSSYPHGQLDPPRTILAAVMESHFAIGLTMGVSPTVRQVVYRFHCVHRGENGEEDTAIYLIDWADVTTRDQR